jgi:hypothetical protein
VTERARNEIWRWIYRLLLLTDWYAGPEVTVYMHAMWRTVDSLPGCLLNVRVGGCMSSEVLIDTYTIG